MRLNQTEHLTFLKKVNLSFKGSKLKKKKSLHSFSHHEGRRAEHDLQSWLQMYRKYHVEISLPVKDLNVEHLTKGTLLFHK